MTGEDQRRRLRRVPGDDAAAHPGTSENIDVGKHNVLGVLVDALDYGAAIDKVLAAVRGQQPFALTALAVHGVMSGVHDRSHNARLNALDVVAPDGQPVRWALNLLYATGLRDWVSGPELVRRVLERMAEQQLPVYLYGSNQQTIDRLCTSLRQSIPGLLIAGAEPSRFRTADAREKLLIAERIRKSGARLVLVGLGCPRQEEFVFAMRTLINVPLLAVGAAFDFHAGRLQPAPAWMQRAGLAWVWRLGQEPRRLWRRYLILNVEYLCLLGAQKLRLWRPEPPPPARWPPGHIPV